MNARRSFHQIALPLSFLAASQMPLCSKTIFGNQLAYECPKLDWEKYDCGNELWVEKRACRLKYSPSLGGIDIRNPYLDRALWITVRADWIDHHGKKQSMIWRDQPVAPGDFFTKSVDGVEIEWWIGASLTNGKNRNKTQPEPHELVYPGKAPTKEQIR